MSKSLTENLGKFSQKKCPTKFFQVIQEKIIFPEILKGLLKNFGKNLSESRIFPLNFFSSAVINYTRVLAQLLLSSSPISFDFLLKKKLFLSKASIRGGNQGQSFCSEKQPLPTSEAMKKARSKGCIRFDGRGGLIDTDKETGVNRSITALEKTGSELIDHTRRIC